MKKSNELGVNDVSFLLQCGHNEVRRLVKRGDLPAIKRHHRWKFKGRDVELFIHGRLLLTNRKARDSENVD